MSRKRLLAILRVGVPLAILGAIAVVWRVRYGDMSARELLGHIGELYHSDWAIPAMLGVFLLSGPLMIPLNLVILATALGFGPRVGIPVAWLGSNLSALTMWGVGILLGGGAVERILGKRAQRVEDMLRDHGLKAVLILRVVPTLPFPMVNLLMGAVRVRFRDFVIGSAIGLIPGVVLISLVGETLADFYRNPEWTTIAGMIGAVLITVGIVIFMIRRARRKAIELESQ